MWWFEYTWPMESATARRYGLVGGSTSLWGQALRSYAQAPLHRREPPPGCLWKTVSSWLPTDQDVELSASPASYLLGYIHASHHDNELNL